MLKKHAASSRKQRGILDPAACSDHARQNFGCWIQNPFSKVNNVFCLSLLGLLDSSYGSIPARARSDRNVLGGSHGLPPHSSMYRYTNSGRSSLRPFYSSFSINFSGLPMMWPVCGEYQLYTLLCGRCNLWEFRREWLRDARSGYHFV